MAKIIVQEKDYTSSGIVDGTTSVVFIPGFRGTTTDSTPTRLAKLVAYGVPTLVSTVADFKDKFGDNAYHYTDASNDANSFTDGAWRMAIHLLGMGMKVLYEACGSDTTKTKADIKTIIEAPTFWTGLEDKSKYDIRFLTTGGYVTIEDGLAAMATCAKDRGDCVALIDHADFETMLSTARTATAIRSNFEKVFTAGNDSGKYCSGFTPWCNFSFDGEGTVEYPATFAYLMAYARSIQTNSEYMAVAGSSRGQIPYLVAPTIEWGDADKDILQGDLEEDDTGTGALAVNPIMNVEPFGYIVYGNRTCLVSNSGLQATSFLNVRNLVSTLRKLMYTTARRLTFEQNSDVLWVRFKSFITPTLDSMVTGNGINGYKMIKVATSKKATLNAVVQIIPIEAVEYFNLTIEMTDTTETVTE